MIDVTLLRGATVDGVRYYVNGATLLREASDFQVEVVGPMADAPDAVRLAFEDKLPPWADEHASATTTDIRYEWGDNGGFRPV